MCRNLSKIHVIGSDQFFGNFDFLSANGLSRCKNLPIDVR